MAAAQRRFSLLLLLAALLLPAHPPFCLASRELDRRFAPRKRCAEPECSKLMCRGKATQDFRGPDCRFVNIKEGETVYVYYKLTGGSAELWAGSVGNEFGYFPKDLLEINLVYTIDELELPTDETDFVCFDGGKDNFDNYNVEELLKSSEEILANGSETKVDTPEMEVTKKEEELQSDDTVPEPGTEEKNDDLAKMDEKDGYVEGVLDTKRDGLAVNRNTENPQGDQIVHQPLEGMLQEKLKGLDRENAKNSSIPQGEANQSDKRSEEIDAYTLLHREMSKDLKTKFGSTADALVSDDETTRLVTSLEDDFNEDLDFDSHNGEKLEDLKQKSEEIPLLLFIGEKETESPVDPEAEKFSLDENPDFESEKHDLDETTRDTAELINQRGNENKDDSGLLTLGDKIFAIVSGGERKNDETDADKTDSEEEEEDEVILVSKEEKTTLPAHLESLTEDELLKKEMDTVDDQDTKGKNNETQEHEEEFTDRTESDTEEMSNAPMYDPGAFPIHGDGLESKPSIETKQEALKPPLGDIKDDPEGITLHKIMKDKKKTGEKILEDSLDNETKHKTLWGNIKEKKPAGDHQSMHVVPKPLEELQNAFQSDLDDIDLSKGKMEHDTEEQVIQQDGENFELTRVLDKENQTTISAEEKAEIPKEEVKETPTQKDLNNPHEEAVRLENETRNSEKDSELSRSTGMEIPGETIGKRPAVEKSSKTAQVANPHSFTEQETEHGEAEDMDKGLHTDVDREKTSRAELQSEESQPEEENSQNEAEEELLEDENAANAKLSRERLANGHSNKSVMESTKPELEIRERSISGAANPVYETGEEANTADENAKKESSVLDLNEVKDMDEAVQIHEASALNEIVESKLEEVSSLSETEPLVASEVEDSLVKEKTQIQDIHERTLPDDVNSLETADGKDDDNQGEELLPEDLSQKDSKDIQDSMEQANISHQQSDPAGPSDASIIMEEAVEPEYRDSVKQLTIMKEFIDEKRVTRLQNFLGPQHVVRIEALFHDMQLELELACKNNHNHDDTEKALDQILESSESSILDAVDKILESRERENKEEVVKEMDLLDAEAALMDDIQELMYSLRQKYSPVIESVPLVPSQESEKESTAPNTAAAKESTAEETDAEFPQQEEMSKEEILKLSEPKEDGNTLKEIALSDEKETRDVHETEEILPREDSAFVATDSGQSDGENFVPGMTTKDDTVEIEGQPIEASPAVPHILATLDGVVLSAKENMRPITEALISTLPEDIRPGPNFHGLPWEPIIITALVGITTLAIFFWRTCLSIKSRMYQVTEKQLVEKIKNLLQQKTELLENMSEYDQKIKEAKDSVKMIQKQNSSLSKETAGLKDTVKELAETNRLLDERVRSLNTVLETERQQNRKKQEKVLEIQKALKKLQEVTRLNSVEFSEVQIALDKAKLSEEKVKTELRHVQEENARLKKSKEQLLKEAEGWSERHTELTEQIKLYQKSQKDIEEALAYKENEIEVLTNCIMQLKQLEAEAKKNEEGNGWDTEGDLANGELPDKRSEKMKEQIKQMMDVSRVKTTLSIVEEDRDLLQSKLNDEIAARHELEEQIKKLEHDSCSVHTAKSRLDNECKTLQQKVEILNELYQQKEMALQKKLTQEEYERQEKEQKLSAADEKAVLAVEEVKVYKQRIQEMEEELQKTERSFKNQIASHEKKAHENWLIARSAERALVEEKREAANLRQKVIEVNQKIAMLQRPVIVKPTPGRPDRQAPPRRGPLSRDGSFGPSPVSGGAPSPPLMMDGPVRPPSANRREASRGEFGAVVDGPPAPRRPSEMSGRMSVPDLSPAVAALANSGPRTSSPSAVMDGMVNLGPRGPPSFPGTPIMTSPATGPPLPPVRFGLPPPPLRGHYGPRPLPFSLVRGPPPPPISRDYPPGPPPGVRDLPPGALPAPEQRGYMRGPPPFRPLGPRDYPPGPRLPPSVLRDYPPPPANRDLPLSGPRDYPVGPPCPPSSASSKDSAHPPEQKP